MLSSSGSASVAPRARSTVRRGTCILVMIMTPVSSLPSATMRLSAFRDRGRGGRGFICARCFLHLKRQALHDSQDKGRPPIAIAPRIPHELAHGWRVMVVQAAAQGVGEQLFGDGPDK